ncbi:MAG TPA: hypothetical protein VK988_06405 [Acidimicrobiales bacterium]|nr:hypothetical protein [Acidimicrobiales bacterium]
MRDMAAAALIALALFTLIVLGVARVWKVRTSKARKLEALHRLEGQLVRVGMNAVAQNFVIEHTGIMRLGQRHDAVLLEGQGYLVGTDHPHPLGRRPRDRSAHCWPLVMRSPLLALAWARAVGASYSRRASS